MPVAEAVNCCCSLPKAVLLALPHVVMLRSFISLVKEQCWFLPGASKLSVVILNYTYKQLYNLLCAFLLHQITVFPLNEFYLLHYMLIRLCYPQLD